MTKQCRLCGLRRAKQSWALADSEPLTQTLRDLMPQSEIFISNFSVAVRVKYFAKVSLLGILSIIAVGCSETQEKYNLESVQAASLSERGETQNPNEDSIWKDSFYRKESLTSERKFKYLSGVPIIASTDRTNAVDVAIANVLLYFNARKGIFTPKPNLTDKEVADEVNSLIKDFEGLARDQNQLEALIVDALTLSNQNSYGLYREAISGLPYGTIGAHIGQLVANSYGKDASIEEIAGAVNKLVQSYGYEVNSTASRERSFELFKDSIDNGRLGVLINRAHNDAYTVTGYRTTNDGTEYLIVHVPTSQTQSVSPEQLLSEADRHSHDSRIKKIEEVLKQNEDRNKQDLIGALDANLPKGVHIYKFHDLLQKSEGAIFIGPAHRNSGKIREYVLANRNS